MYLYIINKNNGISIIVDIIGDIITLPTTTTTTIIMILKKRK